VRDQIVVNSDAPGVPGPIIRIFDHKLTEKVVIPLTSETSNSIDETATFVAITADGQIWLPIDPLNKKKLVRMDPYGTLLPTVILNDYPVAAVTQGPGNVLALTRVPLTIPAPLYSVDASGDILWANAQGPTSFTGSYSDRACVTTGGQVWIAGNTEGTCFCEQTRPRVARLDPHNGNLLDSFYMAPAGLPKPVFTGYLVASPDGTCWLSVNDTAAALPRLYNFDATGVLKSLVPPGISNGTTNVACIDAAGDVWVLDKDVTQHFLLKVSQQNASVLSEYNFGGLILGFALGSSGEDLFAVVGLPQPLARKLVRLNVITGVWSGRAIDPPALSSGIGMGDPTGFVYANVIDQNGDNDRDGWPNRQETLAGSSPYDSLSRPNGPKVYVAFVPGSHAIKLTFKDPDGLIDPQGGLDVTTLSLTIANYGNVFNYLLPFATALDVSPDLTEATLTFGALRIPNNKKWQVEARVADLTGAVGWDWQVTPPGDL
jgi:sugar lactone lactonase YvrE